MVAMVCTLKKNASVIAPARPPLMAWLSSRNNPAKIRFRPR